MRVHEADGRCRACGGTLDVVDADDSTMTVQCNASRCGEVYVVEPDAFGDGGMHYYVAALNGKEEGGEDE
jgi:hypothetical protein